MKRQTIPRALWQLIRQEYQEADLSCRELAEKHGLNPETVSTRCKREGWRRQEAENARLLAAKTEQAIDQKAEDIADRTVAFQNRVRDEAELWLDRIQAAFKNETAYDAIEALQRLLPQWKVAVEHGRKAYGLDREPAIQPLIPIGLMGLPIPSPIDELPIIDATEVPLEERSDQPPP